MMRFLLHLRSVSFGVVAALVLTVVQPAWAQDEEESGDYKDPTIVTEDSTSVPDGVKDLAKKPDKQPIANPIYEKWWFWAGAVGAAGAWIALAVLPLRKQAPGCPGNQGYVACVGDGRAHP